MDGASKTSDFSVSSDVQRSSVEPLKRCPPHKQGEIFTPQECELSISREADRGCVSRPSSAVSPPCERCTIANSLYNLG
jgi:hypothetical protein